MCYNCFCYRLSHTGTISKEEEEDDDDEDNEGEEVAAATATTTTTTAKVAGEEKDGVDILMAYGISMVILLIYIVGC